MATSPSSEVDARRAAARERLEATYEQCAAPGPDANKSCQTSLAEIGNLALSIGVSMEHAEDAARQGWLAPGEVRDCRRRHGMGDSFWDELVRAVNQYRYRR